MLIQRFWSGPTCVVRTNLALRASCSQSKYGAAANGRGKQRSTTDFHQHACSGTASPSRVNLPGTLRWLLRWFLSHSGDFGWFCWGFVLSAATARIAKSPVLPGLLLVGARGFEPPTPSLPD